MSNLSNRDFFKELGKEVLVYPFNAMNIKGASINLSVSTYAWNINTKKKLQISKIEGEEFITIPPLTPVIISTLEAIYVSSRICGTYHSKVSLSAKGLGYISTTLDPKYFGTSLIGVTNNSSSEILLKVGSTFVTVMFSYLQSETLQSVVQRPNRFHQSDIIAQYEDASAFETLIRDTDYLVDSDSLKRKLQKDEDFMNWQNEFSKQDSILQMQIAKKRKSHIRISNIWKVSATIVMYIIVFLLLPLYVWIAAELTNWVGKAFFKTNPTYDAAKLTGPLVAVVLTSIMAALFMFLTKKIYPFIDIKMEGKDDI